MGKMQVSGDVSIEGVECSIPTNPHCNTNPMPHLHPEKPTFYQMSITTHEG